MSTTFCKSANGKLTALIIVAPLSADTPDKCNIDIYLSKADNQRSVCIMAAYAVGLPDYFFLNYKPDITMVKRGNADILCEIIKALIYMMPILNYNNTDKLIQAIKSLEL